MNAEPECLEICDRLSRSLTRARLMPYDMEIGERLDRLDHVLENCRELLGALEAQTSDAEWITPRRAGGIDAPNVIPFPTRVRSRGGETP